MDKQPLLRSFLAQRSNINFFKKANILLAFCMMMILFLGVRKVLRIGIVFGLDDAFDIKRGYE